MESIKTRDTGKRKVSTRGCLKSYITRLSKYLFFFIYTYILCKDSSSRVLSLAKGTQITYLCYSHTIKFTKYDIFETLHE